MTKSCFRIQDSGAYLIAESSFRQVFVHDRLYLWLGQIDVSHVPESAEMEEDPLEVFESHPVWFWDVIEHAFHVPQLLAQMQSVCPLLVFLAQISGSSVAILAK